MVWYSTPRCLAKQGLTHVIVLPSKCMFVHIQFMQEEFALYLRLCYQSQLILTTESSTCSVFILEGNSRREDKLPSVYGLALRIFHFVPPRIGCHSFASFQFVVATSMKESLSSFFESLNVFKICYTLVK